MILIIGLCAFLASFLTLFSGFGLGTLLMPVIAIFFPVQIAVAMTAFVHLFNNIFKLILLRKNINWGVTLTFGIPAILAAIPGAWLLAYLANFPPFMQYSVFSVQAIVTPVKIVVGILLFISATMEWRMIGKNILLRSNWLALGGLVSGFFGGLSGQQGAFRAPFLLHVGLTKQQFVGTNASIAVLVDVARLVVYGITLQQLFFSPKINGWLLWATIFSALLGAAFGIAGLKKITFSFIQRLVVILLYFLGLLLILGVI